MDLTAEAGAPGYARRSALALGAMALVAVVSALQKFEVELPRAPDRPRSAIAEARHPTPPSKPTRHWQAPAPSDCRLGLEPARSEYLATFTASRLPSATLHTSTDLATSTRVELLPVLGDLPRKARAVLGLSSPAPAVYVYPTVAALQKFSCAHDAAVAYYDGSIHVAPLDSDAETAEGLRHEYAHHLLMSNGIHGPFWFQEGAALAFAGDYPNDYLERARRAPLAPSEMVDGLPKTTSLEVATTFYAHAYAMIEFLALLCNSHERCGIHALALALITGRAKPQGLFEWAIAEWSGARAQTWRALWDNYVTTATLDPSP